MTKKFRKTFLHYVLLLLGPPLAWLYLRFTQLSSRIVIDGHHFVEQVEVSNADAPGFIFAFWHNRQIILPIVSSKSQIHCLISASKDGSYVAAIVRLFGKKSIRGSSSRGGFEAMKEMMRVLKAGDCVAITPDGPRGPAGEVNPGIIQMAQAVGVPIIPVAFDSTKKKVFSSWDKFILPYPFSKIAIVFGRPIEIAVAESIESGCEKVRIGLNASVEKATSMLEG
ncbi:MAG: lysophospholipid acyltransferase family protein [Proteobacteria bacterium]|jgi:lysophospholipid acyltransferase (LPLAT)-like uncharacterized protein|nr:lysophospholipid acyltransferase family protein [Pseudomonadota bacterium]